MKKRYLIFAGLLLLSNLVAEIKIIKPTKKQQHSFAIIIDKKTYTKTKNSLIAYRNAVENDGLACYIFSVEKSNPEEIKRNIIKVYNSEKYFEGIVLIGDIPVPMIRDAHHLSSAFKMDPKRGSFFRSSIASDRFYDDFDLQFEFLTQDTTETTLFYYSLTAESAQKIKKEIYSGRIKAPVKGEEKYKLIARYLKRIAKQKKELHEIKNLLNFTGHGYHSESLTAWEWELLCMKEQFPQLYTPDHFIKNLNHASSPKMKKILLAEIQNPALDIAIFHAHGSYDTQYLNGYPPAMNIEGNIRDIKLFLRSKLRQAKRWKRDPEIYKKGYMKRYDLPDTWFDGAFADSLITADSIYGADLDIYAKDLEKIKTQPKFVMFDECYNGQFIKTPYIAGQYLFSGGKTIVTVANSVNVKQDIWADEFLGMLNLGVRVGEWHKTRNFLESHLIGDPTFHFYKIPKKLLKNLYSDKNASYWKKLLKSPNPNYREIAVQKLFQLYKRKYIPQLVRIYNSESSAIVRLQALKCLAETGSPEFQNILCKTAADPAEMIRRITTIWMSKVGDKKYLPYLAKLFFCDHSKRVTRQAKEAMGTIDPDKAIIIIYEEWEKLPAVDGNDRVIKSLENSLKRNSQWFHQDLIGVLAADTTLKAKKNALRTFRNYSFHEGIDELNDFLLDSNEDLELRIIAAEALGWFSFSYRKDEILKFCDKLLMKNDVDDKLYKEVLKTKKRLLAGSNAVITP